MLFAIELVVLALPCVYVLGLFGGVLAVAGAIGAMHGLSGGVGLGDGLLALLLGGLAVALPACGAYAIGHFLLAALGYLRHGPAGLSRRQLRALPWAVPPLAVTLALGTPGLLGLEGWSWLLAVQVSGLGLVLPTLHLWLAWRSSAAPRQA
ncbi:hypothetical protein [Pseudoroseomonas cervicalis]|uniref:hypothetical protein n=1 Tax=Teichococcus cervicalis TaxID=204525 RepID=UPI0022F14604|nr:hypothetical protein [Pseudoroseomonas cervicalis]WBV41363.1 hypothetical protein PFY06_08830 [Pseudoroseomonas cervicalis]